MPAAKTFPIVFPIGVALNVKKNVFVCKQFGREWAIGSLETTS